MAKNLQSKIPKGDTLLIHDHDTNSTAQFVQEIESSTQEEGMGAAVEVLGNPRDVAERAASLARLSVPHNSTLPDECVLSMI